MRKITTSLFFLMFFTGPLGVIAEQDQAFLIKLKAKDAKERSQIANLVHIDSIFEDQIQAIVNSFDLKNITKSNKEKIISVEKLENDLSIFNDIFDFPAGDERYHTYDEMFNELQALSKEYSHIAELFSIGKSVEGRELYGIKITDNNIIGSDEGKPAIAYFGAHHAREHLSTEIPMLFINQILHLSDTDPTIKELISKLEIYVIPMVNPDGASYDIESGSYRWWRKNRKANRGGSFGVDLNRNYSFGWGTGGSSTNPRSDVYMGSSAFSEPETRAVRDFLSSKKNLKVALSLHTFSELILYPWGGKEEGVGGYDQDLFVKMANDIAAINHYKPMQSSGLYIASGDTCDYAYGELHIYCLTFELSPSSMSDGGFYPGASVVDQVFSSNWPAMLYLANKALTI